MTDKPVNKYETLSKTSSLNATVLVQVLESMQAELDLLGKQFDLLHTKVNLIAQFLGLSSQPSPQEPEDPTP